MEENEGLLLWPCSAVHCFGMHFSIDVVFLDRRYQVLCFRENMEPGSHASNRQARYVLELKAGAVQKHRIQIGERLIISFNPLDKSK